MASLEQGNQLSHKNIELSSSKGKDFNNGKREQWLRAAIPGVNGGLFSVASLMMGVGAVKREVMAMILAGFAGLVDGDCSMAIGEFVSV